MSSKSDPPPRQVPHANDAGMLTYSPRDIVAGAIFAAFGGAVAWIGSGYRLGSMTNMGPGFAPVAAGGILATLGLLVAGRGLFVPGRPIPALQMYLLAMIVGPVFVFGVAIETLGLILACVLLVVVCRLASRPAQWRETILLAFGLTAFTWILFVRLLGFPFDALPEIF